MTLKQQQAGVIEAREAVMQGHETLTQGKSIMLFTVVTVIFVSTLDRANLYSDVAGSAVVFHWVFWYEQQRV